MTPIVALVLGLLIGWLVEWVIDRVYWRRRFQSLKDAEAQCHQNLVALDRELVGLETAHAQAKQEIQALRAQQAVPPLLIPDDLEQIKGIGPVIAKKLNRSGVHTFEQLAAQTPDWLRSVLGAVIERLADEDSLIQQARQYAERKAKQGAGEK